MKKISILFIMALASLSATGELYCAAEAEPEAAPEAAAGDANRRERTWGDTARDAGLLGGAAAAWSAVCYGVGYAAAGAWDRYSQACMQKLASNANTNKQEVQKLIENVLYQLPFMQEPKWSQSFRWILEQIAQGNDNIKGSFRNILIALKKQQDGSNIEYNKERNNELIRHFVKEMSVRKPWSLWGFQGSNYNTVDLYNTELLSVPAGAPAITGKMVVDNWIEELTRENPSAFQFLYR